MFLHVSMNKEKSIKRAVVLTFKKNLHVQCCQFPKKRNIPLKNTNEKRCAMERLFFLVIETMTYSLSLTNPSFLNLFSGGASGSNSS